MVFTVEPSSVALVMAEEGKNSKKALMPINRRDVVNEGKRIVNDPCEYWKYLFSYSRWKNTQDGVLVTLLEVFTEIRTRGWSVNDYQHSDAA